MNADISLLVAGGGPAGIAAALQARELGAQVTLLEAGEVGGTSLNRGPAPVRTLARAALLARDWSSWSSFGLRGAAPVPDLPAVLANSKRVARYALDKKDLGGHLRRQGIDLIEDLGPVRFTGPRSIAAMDGRAWSADRVILAVGGHAARLPIPGAGHALTYEDIPSLTSLPRRVNGHSMLVQTARMERRIAARNAVLGPTRQATYDVVPSGSFTDPEYGRVGLTETQAAHNHDVITGIARYEDLPRPVADGRPTASASSSPTAATAPSSALTSSANTQPRPSRPSPPPWPPA